MSFWTAANQRYAYNYLRGAGLSNYGAAGLVSRWANVESTVDGPRAQGGYLGRAFGIAQWLGARLTPIKGNTNFAAQLAYVVKELNSTETRAANVLKTATSAAQGAVGASMYERAGGYNAATGKDNYTSRTAQGIPAVLALATGGVQAAPETAVNADASGDSSTNSAPGSSGDIGPLILLAAIGVGLFLWLR